MKPLNSHDYLVKEFEKIRGKSFDDFKLPYDVGDYNQLQDEYIEWLEEQVMHSRDFMKV